MKNLIIKKSRESKLPIQQLYGLYAMDRLILKLSKTSYADNLIVKGGFLLTTDLGVSMRATRDLDFTIRNCFLGKDTVDKLTEVISKNDENSTEYFELKSINETREKFEYNGYSLKLVYQNGNTKIPINVDITSGEELIGVNDRRQFKSIFTNEVYMLSSYSMEQIIIDKFHTLLAFGEIDDTNSRMKDYYDLYLLTKTNNDIDLNKVILGLNKTMNQRNTFIHTEDYDVIIDFLTHSNKQRKLWSVFSSGNPYAENINFEVIMEQIKLFSNRLIEQNIHKTNINTDGE
jgi:predicted nucleotidyltransferase component of viral defense system